MGVAGKRGDQGGPVVKGRGAGEGRGVADIDREGETGLSEHGTLKLSFQFGERGK